MVGEKTLTLKEQGELLKLVHSLALFFDRMTSAQDMQDVRNISLDASRHIQKNMAELEDAFKRLDIELFS